MSPDVAAANADQVAYWNGENGDKWARLQERLDGLFKPISDALVAAAAARRRRSCARHRLRLRRHRPGSEP